MFFSVKKYLLILFSIFVVAIKAQAGAYIFAGEANGINLITHPNSYTGSQSVAVVRICINPASPNATDMEIPVQNNINVFNQLQPTTANIKLGSNNNIASNQIDFESVALHEIGHCLGLAHVNLASESGLTGNNQNYTKTTDGADNSFNIDNGDDNVIGSSDDVRGDDVNLHWFQISNNNPFTIDSVVDETTYSVDVADLPPGDFVANADRSLSTFLGLPQTEAVMQQGTFFDEAQRTLVHDDVATISYAASGLDEQAGTGDDYIVQLEYGGISSSNCDVSLSMTTTAGLAFCSADGELIGNKGPNRVLNHLRVKNAFIEFGDAFNWFFNPDTNNQAPVLSAIGNQSLFEQGLLQINITANDADGDNLSLAASNLPAFANFIDNGDGTATLTLSPVLGDESTTMVTITVSDDGLPVLDVQETFQLTVNELDSDGDGLGDYDEINVYFTDPANPDSDGDGFNDGDEINAGSDPNDPLSWPVFADGDLAPLGAPDGVINAADYLIAQRIVLGEITATSLEFSHGDLHPLGSPDGVIDVSDLVLILQLVQQ